MPSIRPVEPSDLPAVAEVVRANFSPWWGDESFLAASVIDHPWADEGLPSYLAVDDGGEVVGFIGAQVRRLRFGDRTIRGVCCTQLGVVQDRRAGAAGALLVGRLLDGDQELTWSDSATDRVARMWRLYGGHLDHVRACDWMFVLRSGSWARGVLRTLARRRKVGRELTPVGALPFHAAGRRLVPGGIPERGEDVTGQDATIELLVDHLPAIKSEFRLCVDHDEEHLEHLFAKLQMAGSPVVRRLVRRGGRAVGWYVYIPRPGGVSRVLHLAAPEPHADAVLGELVEHAREAGSAVVSGRAEPHLMTTLRRHIAVLGPARTPIFQTRDPELAAVLATGSSLLTRLDGEVLVA